MFIAKFADHGWGQPLIERPICCGALVGLVLGDLRAGVMIGASLELVFLGTITIGGSLPADLAVGVPLQLLENRPDVKAAELALADAYYTTNQARSAFYPSVNITGTLGWTNGSNGTVISNPAVMLWNAIGSLTQPIFQRGKLIANLKVSKAEEQIAKMNYQQTILEAGKEVSDALFLYDTADKKLSEHQAQVSEMQKAVEMNNDLFQAGKATYLEIITAQQSLLSAQLNEVSDTFQRMQAVINLYSALGGGRE